MWVWLTCLAVAGQVTAEDFGKMAAELVPQVERASGRAFAEMPVLELTDFVTYWNESVPVYLKGMQDAGFTKEEIDAEMIQRQKDLRHTLALERDGRIYILADRIEEAYADAAVPPEVLEPVMECLLAHELVHVLQHQTPVPPATSTEQWLDRRVLVEGHADFVSEAVCRARGNLDGIGLRRGWKGIEAVHTLTGPPDVTAVRYGFGREWSALVAEERGAKAIWKAYAEPPTREEVVEAVRKRAPEPPVSLSEVGAALQPDATVRDTNLFLLGEWRLLGRSALEALASVESVQAVAIDAELGSGVMYRVDFEASRTAAGIVAARRDLGTEERVVRNKAYVEGYRGTVYGFAHKAFIKPFPQIDKLVESDDSVRVSYIDTAGKYAPSHLYWVAKGKTLVVFRCKGESRVFPRARVAQAMADALGSAP